MKRLFTSIAFASLAAITFAGGLRTNTNQSSAFVRNPARFATLDIDAVYFNPAGTAFFQDGWSFSANWQMIWQQRDAIDKTGGRNTKYDGKVYVPCMPTIHAAYHTGDWTFSGFFGMPGGGGKAEFNNGLPLFDNLISSIIPGAQVASQFESTQYLFALQLGAAYKITDNFSAYAGIRGNYTSNNYQGTIKAVANGQDPMAVNLDLDQSGIAFAPIFGLDYKIGNFNFAAKYEFRAVTTVENDTKMAPAAAAQTIGGLLGDGFADGSTLRADAPAMLSLAGSWQIIPRLQIMGGWNYYFDKDAKVESLMGGDNMKNLSRNTIEYTFGTEFKLTEKLLLSAGIQYTNFGINDKYVSNLDFTNDSFMTGVGAKYSINNKIDINVGYCYANYAHDTATDNKYMLTTDYRRKTHNATIGVDFRL